MPISILKSIALQWDIFAGRYQAYFATKKDDIDGCIKVLEEVRRKELNRVSGDSVIQSSAFADKETNYQLIACKDTKSGEIIGCMRLTKAREIATIESSREEYLLDLFDDKMIDKFSIFTRLAVLKAYRGSPVALVIMAYAFLDVLEKGGQAILMSCEPNLFKMYKRLGLRPIGSLHNSSSGGYRIPMICMPDLAHFQLIRSPALPLLSTINWEQYRGIKNWYLDLIREKGEIQIGATPYEADESDKEEHWSITQGLSEDSRNRFLKNAISIRCQEGDLLIAKKDGGKFFGIIRRGFGRVLVGGKTIAILSKGNLFGEIAYILDQYRSADVVAGDSST
ncbi:MAG: hypothetical protein ACI8P3_004525, partial [Saprospiraceae bacterium]